MPDTICHSCGEFCVEQYIDDTLSIRYEGKQYAVEVSSIPVMTCPADGTIVSAGDLQMLARRGLRKQLGLMQPEEIRAARESLGMTQEDMERVLKIAVESQSRWENDRVVQSRAMNTLLVAFFMNPSVFLPKKSPEVAAALMPQYVNAPQADAPDCDDPQLALAA